MGERSEQVQGRSAASVWVLAAVLALVPIVSANLTGLGIGHYQLLYDAVELPRFVLTIVGVLLAWTTWLIASARSGERSRFDTTAWLLVALTAWAALSTAFSTHPELSVLGQSERLGGLITVLGYLLLYAVALQAVRSTRDVRLLASGIGIAAGLSAAYGLSQYLGFDPTSYAVASIGFSDRRAAATFGNPDFLAGFLVLAVPCVVGLALSSRKPWALAWGAVAVLSTGALFVTYTRGGWIAGVAEAVVALVVWWRQRGRVRGTWPWLAMGATAFVVVLALISPVNQHGQSALSSRIAEAGTSGGSVTQRLEIIDAAIAATRARPVFGYGPATFLPAFRLHRPTPLAEEFGSAFTINNAHSWPFQYAATLGVLGGVLLVMAVVSALWGARSTAFAPARRQSSVLLGGVWIGCFGYAVFMLASVAVHGASTPFWVLAGALGAASSSASARDAARSPWRTRVLIGIAAALTVASVAAGASLLAADAAYMHSRLVYHGVADGNAIGEAELATRLNPLSIKYARGLASLRIDACRQAIAERARPAVVRARLADAERALSGALGVDPSDYPTLAWKAGVEASAASYLNSQPLSAEGVATAKQAERLDCDPVQVADIAAGNFTPQAVQIAASAQPLP